MTVTPIVIIIFEPLLALAGIYVAVFKTVYEPRYAGIHPVSCRVITSVVFIVLSLAEDTR